MRSASPSSARAPASRSPLPRPAERRAGVPVLVGSLVVALLVVPSIARAQALRGEIDDRGTAATAATRAASPGVAPDLLGLGEAVSPLAPTLAIPSGTAASTGDPAVALVRDGAGGTAAATGSIPARKPVTKGPVLPVVPAEDVRAVAAVAATQPSPRDPDPRTAEEAEKADEAYAPLGLRALGLTWTPALELGIGGRSNVDSTRGGRSSATWTIEPELIGRSDWSRHSLELSLRGGHFAYPNAPDQSRSQYRGELRGGLDLGDLTRADLVASWSRQRESTSVTEAATTGDGTDRETRAASLGLTRDVGLVALTLRGEMERNDYFVNGTLPAGSIDPSVQDNTRWVAAFRTTLGPTRSIAPFVEVQTGIRRYDEALVYGLKRDGNGGAVKVGVVLDAGPTLRGEISTGWGLEKPAEGSLSTMSGWLVDGRLTWSPTRLVVVKTQVKTAFDPTTNAGSPGALTRSFAVDLDWSVRRDVTATLGAGLDTKHYFGIDVDERTAMASAGLVYKFDRNFQTFIRAKFEHVTASNAPSYDVGTVISGIRIQR